MHGDRPGQPECGHRPSDPASAGAGRPEPPVPLCRALPLRRSRRDIDRGAGDATASLADSCRHEGILLALFRAEQWQSRHLSTRGVVIVPPEDR